MSTSKATAIMDAIRSVTTTDFEAITAEIKAKEAELTRLREVRRFVGVAVGAIKPRHQRSGAANRAARAAREADAPRKPTLTEKYRRDAAAYLIQHGNAPTRAAKLADAVGFPDGSASTILACPWFLKSEQGYSLSPAGRRECEE